MKTTNKLLKIVMSLLLALAVVPSFAFGEDEDTTAITSSTTSITTSGNYILNEDITLSNTDQYYISIVSNIEVTIDLNGHSITQSSSSYTNSSGTTKYDVYVFYINAKSTVTIKDSSSDGNGAIIGGNTCLYIENYSSNETVTTVNLQSGTIKDADYQGVYIGSGALLNMTGGTITNNGACTTYSSTLASGVHLGKSATSTEYYGSKFQLSGGSITGNKQYGIYSELANYNSIEMTGGTISNNAYSGINLYGSFTMSGGEISENGTSYSSVTYAGAMYVQGNSNVKLTGGTIKDNKSKYGGAISLVGNSTAKGPSLYAENVTFKGNNAVSWGGVLYVSGDGVRLTPEFKNCTFIENVSQLYGGVFYIKKKTDLTITGCTIEGNQATGSTSSTPYGSVISSGHSKYAISDTTNITITIKDSKISNNSTTGFYGAIYANYYTKLSIDNTIITGNSSSNYAGGIYVTDNNCSFTISNSTITGNSGTSGGGIYTKSSDSNNKISNTILANNTATNRADDLYLYQGAQVTIENVNDDVEYTFDEQGLNVDGWYNDSDNSRYRNGTITEIATIDSSNSAICLVAAHDTSYSVTYKDGVDDEEVFEDATLYTTGSVPDFTGSTDRTGYTFKGWTTDSEVTDSSTIITDFSDTTITANTIYYAVWTKNSYALNVDDIDNLTISTDDEDNEIMTYSDTVYDTDSGKSFDIPVYVNGEEATSDVITSVSTDSSNITVTEDSDGTSITLTLSDSLSSGEYSETFTVTYEDDSTETFTVTFTVDCDHSYDYDDIEWTWSDDYSSATATVTCSKDSSHTETIEATVTSETESPTFTSEGKTVYTATITVDGQDYTDTVTVAIDKLSLSVVESQSANVTITTDENGTMILSITSAVTSDDTQKIILSLSGDIELSDDSVTIETEYGYVTVEIDEDGNLVITPDIDALNGSGEYTDTITITVISEDGTTQDIIVTFTYDADTGEITEETADTGDGDSNNETDTADDDVETEVTQDGEDGSTTTATSTSSDTEETADADTSDNTVMYIYSLVGLTTACGAYYVIRRRKES